MRHRKAVRALPVLLAVLLALGLLGTDRAATGQVAGQRPATAGMVVLVATPADADAVVGVRPLRHLPVRTLRLGLFEVGVLAAGFAAHRVARWLPARPPETLPAAAGLAVRRGRAPPPVGADGVHAREATGR
ncbi:hypothetical protein Raf01_40320 [Rugosimonospora africana]|uniref:Uncharacterized protein n=2 Tax=Rugosimonospora africana TaxID=556532 RepID=A0A8J3QU65_9ACTN|nr:hypothetical protein Raf01_40320 [Rugosimonospora africana]